MKTSIGWVLGMVACGAVAAIGGDQAGAPTPDSQFHDAKAAVYFSPAGGATDAVVREIGAARFKIGVQAYSFTSPAIVSALKKAHDRGVGVYVLLDKSNLTGKYSGASYLLNAGVPVGIDPKHAIAHNKVVLIDPGTPGATVLTGSFNFTAAAEKSNAENLLILRDCPELMKSYYENWKVHAAHSYDANLTNSTQSAKTPAKVPTEPTE